MPTSSRTPIVQRARAWMLRLTAALGLVLATVLAVRAWDAHARGPLSLWHTHVPHELRADALDGSDWAGWLRHEQSLLDEVEHEVSERLPDDEQVPANRYWPGSPLHPRRFAQDWNRSYVLVPDGPPVGAVVLLHGLTDSPYSLRHLARRYRDRGFVAVGIRLPGHGTVPAGLTDVDWEDWAAATRLAVREARARTGGRGPLHIVGFSNGAALALDYAVAALDDAALPAPDRLVLLSPMIGVTRLARFAGVLGWPAVFPPFARAAWLDVLPEFNPFKYNSFPVHAARESSRLTRHLQAGIAAATRDGRLSRLPPVLAFQSVLDYTVSTRAVVDDLFARLPANGSELVLFDMNQTTPLGPLIRADHRTLVSRLLPPPPRLFRSTVVTNTGPDGELAASALARTIDAGATTELLLPLDVAYPPEVYSLSHVALPFPPDDALYGARPSRDENFGVQLGAAALRGERAGLVVSQDALVRMSWNPFYGYLAGRIDALATPAVAARAAPALPGPPPADRRDAPARVRPAETIDAP